MPYRTTCSYIDPLIQSLTSQFSGSHRLLWSNADVAFEWAMKESAAQIHVVWMIAFRESGTRPIASIPCLGLSATRS